MSVAETQPFLLNQDHRSFIEGRSRRLESAERAHYAHSFFLGPPTLIALMICLVWLGYVSVTNWQEEQTRQQLATSGVETLATITELRDDGRGLQPYRLTYSFAYTPTSTAARATAASEQPISVEEFRTLQVGDPIPVRYLPEDPTVSRVPTNLGINLWFYFPVLLLPVLIWSLMGWFHALRHWRWLRRLETEGRLLPGEVIDSSKGMPLPKYRVQVWVEYCFRTPEGRELTDWGEGSMEKDDPLPPPGAPVHVLYVSDRVYRLL